MGISGKEPTADDKKKMIAALAEDLEPIQLYALRNGLDPTKAAAALLDLKMEKCPHCGCETGIVYGESEHDEMTLANECEEMPDCWKCGSRVYRCTNELCNHLIDAVEAAASVDGECFGCEQERRDIEQSDLEQYRKFRGDGFKYSKGSYSEPRP